MGTSEKKYFMAEKKSKKQKEFWQLSMRSINDEGKTGTALEIYHPIDGTHKVLEFIGGELSRNKPDSAEDLIHRWTIAIERKVKAEGVDIPDIRRRLKALIIQRWFPYLR